LINAVLKKSSQTVTEINYVYHMQVL